MSTSTDAILAYGIDLGEDVDWDELGYVHVDDCGECDYEDEGCINCADNVSDWLSARLTAEGIKGVSLTRHCSLSYPMWLLTSRSVTVHRGSVHTLDKAFLNVPAAETLAIGEAARVLGLATDVEPQWLLVSFWDL